MDRRSVPGQRHCGADVYGVLSGSRVDKRLAGNGGSIVNGNRQTRVATGVHAPAALVEKEKLNPPPSSFLQILLACNISLTSTQQHIGSLELIQKQ